MIRTAALLVAALAPSANAKSAELQVNLVGLRSDRGLVHACLTQNPNHFPSCEKDPARINLTVPTAARQLRFSGIVPGRYALSLIHDENSNRKLDKFTGIPREGFGFSRSPVVRFGPPRFDQVVLDVGPGLTRTTVRMQYLL